MFKKFRFDFWYQTLRRKSGINQFYVIAYLIAHPTRQNLAIDNMSDCSF